MKIELNAPDLDREAIENNALILASWHEASLTLPIIKPAIEKRFALNNPALLVSRSRDGSRLSPLLDALSVTPIRGSSNARDKSKQDKGGLAALLYARNHLRQGSCLVVAVDGPRGPAKEIKPGVLALLKHTQANLLFLHARYRAPLRANSWDRMFIPYPFATVELTVCQAIDNETGLDIAEQSTLAA